MADDALRMQAEIVDKFSGPLKNLQTQLRGISGGPGVKQLKKDLEEVQGHMAKTATVAKDLLNPALAGFGIAALSAGGALVGIGSAIRGFSADSVGLTYLGREVGMSANKLRELEAVGRRFDLDPSHIAGATRTFADQLDQMHRNRGELYNYLLQQGSKDPTGNVARWTQAIKGAKSNTEAFNLALGLLSNIKDPLQRADMAVKLFGDRAMAVLGSEGADGLQKQIDAVRKNLGTLGDGAGNASIAFERSISGIREQLRGLRDDLGPDLLQPLNNGLSELGGWLREHKGDIREGIVDGLTAAKSAIREFPWAEAKAGAAAFFGEIKVLGQETATAIRAVGDALGIVKDLLHGNVGDALKKLGKIDGETDLGLGKDRPAGRIQDGMRGDLAPLMLRQGDLQKRLAILDESIARKESQPDPMGDGHVVATEERQRRDKLTDEIKKLTEEIRRKREQDEKTKSELKADPASFDGGGSSGARIVKASLGGGGFGGGLGGGAAALGGRAGGGGSGGPLRERGGGLIPAIPDNVPMTAAERNTLGLIMKYESHGQNTMNYMGKRLGLDPQTAKGYTAQGYYQMLNSNWRRIAPLLGIKTRNAMSSTLEEQTRVALHLLRHGGVGNWANYNPALRAALARREQIAAGNVPRVAPSIAKGDDEKAQREIGDGLKQIRPWTKGAPKAAEKRADLMGRARAAGVVGASAKAEGQVHVNVNAPPGWRANTSSKGELFREVRLNRGNAMQLASQEA